jgi:hypothetical protein
MDRRKSMEINGVQPGAGKQDAAKWLDPRERIKLLTGFPANMAKQRLTSVYQST